MRKYAVYTIVALVALAMLIPSFSPFVDGLRQPYVVEVEDGTFASEVLDSSKPVVVKFYATWCGACRSFGPVFEQAVSSNDEVKFVKVDVDQNPKVSAMFVQALPTTIYFQRNPDGSWSALGAVGGMSPAQLQFFLESAADPDTSRSNIGPELEKLIRGF